MEDQVRREGENPTPLAPPSYHNNSAAVCVHICGKCSVCDYLYILVGALFCGGILGCVVGGHCFVGGILGCVFFGRGACWGYVCGGGGACWGVYARGLGDV